MSPNALRGKPVIRFQGRMFIRKAPLPHVDDAAKEFCGGARMREFWREKKKINRAADERSSGEAQLDDEARCCGECKHAFSFRERREKVEWKCVSGEAQIANLSAVFTSI